MPKIIIIGDYALRNILPPRLINLSERYKVVGGCDCSIYSKNMHFYFLTWHDHQLKDLNIKVTTFKIEGLV